MALAFSSAVWVVYFHVGNDQAYHAIWFIFFLNFFWTLLYDTQYAMGDYADDQHLPIHSSVKFFKKHTQTFNAALMLILFSFLAGVSLKFSNIAYILLGLTTGLFIWQWVVLARGKWEVHALRVFLSHMYIGMMWTIWLTLQ